MNKRAYMLGYMAKEAGLFGLALGGGKLAAKGARKAAKGGRTLAGMAAGEVHDMVAKPNEGSGPLSFLAHHADKLALGASLPLGLAVAAGAPALYLAGKTVDGVGGKLGIPMGARASED